MKWHVHHADCRRQLADMDAGSFHACVTDPPYELGFMGAKWDRTGIAFEPEVWAAVLRVLKPGAHLVAFGGTRTYHRMACAVEDAGFEVRDQLAWVFGSGLPKSLNLEGDWSGWGTALKPAWEPIILARKPLRGTVADAVRSHGTGALNIDACRIATDDEIPSVTCQNITGGRLLADNSGRAPGPEYRQHAGGRWPANLVHDGSDEVLSQFPHVASGQPCGFQTGRPSNAHRGFKGGYPVTGYGDEGSASRFFYCAKASPADRNVGGCDNTHPTVKPTDLMRWLCRLVTPGGGARPRPVRGFRQHRARCGPRRLRLCRHRAVRALRRARACPDL